jgi:hypothetical protein
MTTKSELTYQHTAARQNLSCQADCLVAMALADSCSATLNQNEQYDYTKDSSDDSDDLHVIHSFLPSLNG